MPNPIRPASVPPPPVWPHGPSACRSCAGTVSFFFGLLCLVSLVAGVTIIALAAKVSYLHTQFPRVAEHNYRTLRADLAAVERRLQRAVDAACSPTSPPTDAPQIQ